MPSGARSKLMRPATGSAHVKRLKPSVLPPAPRSNMTFLVLAYSGRGPIRRARAFARSPNTDRLDPNDGEKFGSHFKNGAGVLSSALMSCCSFTTSS